jgi:hypothetical protein
MSFFPQYIDSSAAIIFRELHNEDCLRGLSRDAFAGRLDYYLGEVNALHPFREGNGRRSGPSSRSSRAAPGSRPPGSILMPPATSGPPLRSCAATQNRCGRCAAPNGVICRLQRPWAGSGRACPARDATII